MGEESGKRSFHIEVFAAALLWAAAIYLILRGSAAFACPDSYFHIKIAEIMRVRMSLIRDFEWATCSTWAVSFYDKDLLFHIYLAPFTLLGLNAGAKLAIVTAVFLMAVSTGFMLREAGLRRHYFLAMAFVLFASGPMFMGRLILCRSILFSVLLMIFATICVFRQARWALFAVAFIYSLTYAGSWQIVPAVLIFDIARRKFGDGGFRVRDFLVFWALAGIVAGTLANPYFPENIRGGFVQSIMVLKAKWLGTGQDEIIQASELSAMTGDKFLRGYLLLFVALAFTLHRIFRDRKLVFSDWRLTGLMLLSAAYLPATLLSMRFGEYLAPFLGSFLAVLWLSRTDFFERWPRRLIAFLVILIIALSSSFSLRSWSYSDHPRYADAGKWMRCNLRPGEIVFTGDWDDPPPLFFGAPALRYLVFLEPYFMYSYSPEKYRIWKKISFGKMESTALAIRAEFDSTAVFVPPDRPRLLAKLLKDPYARLAFKGSDGEAIFLLDVPEEKVAEWNMAKNLFRPRAKP